MIPMRPFFRPRLTLFAMMLIVAVFAGIFGVYAAVQRRKHIAALTNDLRRAEDRVEWAGRMKRRGYVSAATCAAEEQRREQVRAELKSLGALPDGS
jgi:hypothetical protein